MHAKVRDSYRYQPFQKSKEVTSKLIDIISLRLRIGAGIIAAALMVAAASCGGRHQWTVDGSIEGAEGQTMILEASNSGRWYALDSVKLGRSGTFSLSQDAAGYPDIYRLRLGNKSLYFPIDSIEQVTVVAKADAFDSDYTLTGTPAAELLMKIDRQLLESAAKLGMDHVASDSMLKRELGSQLLGDPAGIVSYYLINKKIGGVSLFNPANRRDLSIIGAVANAFSEQRPNDPRTAYLRNLYVESRQRLGSARPVTTARRDTMLANTVGILDINLYDSKGKLQSLAETASKGKPVVLNFTMYGADASPAYNAALNRIYERFHDRGLEIYQVAIDEDEFSWRQAAKNLPWIAVYNSTSDGVKYLTQYNVNSLPVSFVIGADGEIKERIETIDRLESAVARQF